MNEIFKTFIEKNNININEIYSDLRIYNEKEINKIIYENRLDCQREDAFISIADIIGYDYTWRNQTNNLAANFSGFFSMGSSYQQRSISMLEYTSDEVIEGLSRSFKTEPIQILELDGGKKVVTDNGLHRYTVLRLHYINELSKIKGNKEKEEELRKKYTIPVRLTKVDLFKTYCQFLIKEASQDRVYVCNNYDSNFDRTGLVEVTEGNKRAILNDEELLEYTKYKIINMPSQMREWFNLRMVNYSEQYESFKSFINTYLSKEIQIIPEETTLNRKGGL